MRMILTAIPESSQELAGVPEDWSLNRRIELHWLPDARHPDVTAEVVIPRITVDPDGTRHMHLANTDPGQC
jgi:hypothetical protein